METDYDDGPPILHCITRSATSGVFPFVTALAKLQCDILLQFCKSRSYKIVRVSETLTKLQDFVVADRGDEPGAFARRHSLSRSVCHSNVDKFFGARFFIRCEPILGGTSVVCLLFFIKDYPILKKFKYDPVGAREFSKRITPPCGQDKQTLNEPSCSKHNITNTSLFRLASRPT
jgi:hypothetical protein